MASSKDVEISVGHSGPEENGNKISETDGRQEHPETTVVPFVPSKLYLAAKWTLDLMDDWGERLAYFFGITSPKYAVHISAHNRQVREDQQRSELQSQEFSGWRTGQGHGYENPVINHTTESSN